MVTLSQFSELKEKFSIRNFISDLPRMLNNAFTVIYEVITQFYDITNDKIDVTSAKITYLNADTIVSNNITFNSSTGETFNYANLTNDVAELKSRLDNITFITKRQLDTLNAAIYPTQTLTVGVSEELNTRIKTGNIVYESYDTSIATCDPKTKLVTGISEGFTYISVSNSTDSEIVYIRVIPATE